MTLWLAILASTLTSAGAPVTSSGKGYTLPAPPAELTCKVFPASRSNSDLVKCSTKAFDVSILLDLAPLRPGDTRTAKAMLEAETRLLYGRLKDLKVRSEGVNRIGGLAGYRKTVSATGADGRAIIQINWVLVAGKRFLTIMLHGHEEPFRKLEPRIETWLKGLKVTAR